MQVGLVKYLHVSSWFYLFFLRYMDYFMILNSGIKCDSNQFKQANQTMKESNRKKMKMLMSKKVIIQTKSKTILWNSIHLRTYPFDSREESVILKSLLYPLDLKKKQNSLKSSVLLANTGKLRILTCDTKLSARKYRYWNRTWIKIVMTTLTWIYAMRAIQRYLITSRWLSISCWKATRILTLWH